VTAGGVDQDLEKFLSKTWKKKSGGQAALIKEICVTRCKTGGAPEPVCTITKETLDSYADTREMARDLDERMQECARFHAGTVRFEVTLWGGEGTGLRPLANQPFQRQGQGQPEIDTFDTTAQGQLTMYMREAHRDRELTITTLRNQIEKLDARNDRLHNIVDQMMGRYPELLDLMNRLADGEMEREIRRRQAFRMEGVKDRALRQIEQLVPIALSSITGGKINLLEAGTGKSPTGGNPQMMAEIEPHLLALFSSLAGSGDRGEEIGKLMTEDEKSLMGVIGTIIFQYAAKAREKTDVKDVEVKQSTNGKTDVPAAPSS
jgi:hypothetical protein